MRVCVVGAGAAGMMAAITAAENGNNVTLIEKNEKLGKKLFLTGKGRCNLTNSCSTEELFNNVPKNPKFLYSAFYDFDNSATMAYFESLGLKLKEERGNRVFPSSDHSSDVINTLAKKIKSLGIRLLLNTEVVNILVDENDKKISGVTLKNGDILSFDKIILAIGGKSYPTTGSDGSFFEEIKRHNLTVTEFLPSLVPLVTDNDYVMSMQGLSLKNVSIIMKVNDKNRFSGFGEMLFTHFGVSGPLILSASAHLNHKDYDSNISILIDLKPALSYEELDKRIIRDFTENQNKIFENSLNKLLPSKMISSVIKLSGIDPGKRVNLITRQERNTLVKLLKEFPVHIIGNRGYNEAIITRGGVSVKEINPSTMESKRIKGLYFAGEMIDVDAYTGGFNLQIAWSTGHLAGVSCAE